MGKSATLRIGFVPLVDAAPLVVANELGYFREEGLDASLHRQIGWANVRDKLTYGHLEAGHALLGMPLTSQLGRDAFVEPLTAVMGLGTGGNAITVSRALHEGGVRSATDLAAYRTGSRHSPLLVGHVFNSSMHHYLLRDWLSSGGIDPDKDVKLCVIPPTQMPDHMRGGYVDIFCVGEPWNTLGTLLGYGTAIVATTDILPNHPEKVLAVTQRFAEQNVTMVTALVRAVLRACKWCDEPGHRRELAAMLARPEYIHQSAGVIEQSLAIDRQFGTSRLQRSSRLDGWQMKSFAPENTFPNKMHTVWMMQQMVRWGHLHVDADLESIAERCSTPGAYRQAAASLGIACPAADFVPMKLRHGQVFTPEGLRAEMAMRAPNSKPTKASRVPPRLIGNMESSFPHH